MNCFIYFLFSLPISHIFIITFLILRISLNFQFNFGPRSQMVWFYFSTSHTSHTTNIRAASSLNQNVIYLVTYFVVRWSPGDLVNVYVDTIFPSHLNLYPVQNLPFVFHFRLFYCEDCARHMLDINRALFQLWRSSPRVFFFHIMIGKCITCLPQRTIKFFFVYFIFFISWGMLISVSD